LPGGQVRFAPIAPGTETEAGKPGFALVAEDGTFEVGTYSKTDGAVVGDHWVTIYSYNPRLGQGEVPKGAKFSRFSVPEPASVVAGQTNTIDFAITSDQIAKYGVPVGRND
jgi:hypothetical protein